jgi:hypothetical protein
MKLKIAELALNNNHSLSNLLICFFVHASLIFDVYLMTMDYEIFNVTFTISLFTCYYMTSNMIGM